MAYEIELTDEARDDVKALRRTDQVVVLEAIETQLRFEPNRKTRNRKRLRTNALAEWELRVGKFRVFYNVEEDTLVVSIEAIGFKIGSLLFIRNERSEL